MTKNEFAKKLGNVIYDLEDELALLYKREDELQAKYDEAVDNEDTEVEHKIGAELDALDVEILTLERASRYRDVDSVYELFLRIMGD